MSGTPAAAREIRQVADAWVIHRDTGAWDDLGRLWHDEGWMTTTWFQGPHQAFVEASARAFAAGVEVGHILGGHASRIEGTRAVAQTRMKIEQRARAEGVEVDAVCTGRFYDFFERRAGRWALVRRQPVYERDRLDPVDPGVRLSTAGWPLDRFPAGYRHLGCLQAMNGQRVFDGLPGLRGPAGEQLHQQGRAWLAGHDRDPESGEPLTRTAFTVASWL